MKKLMWLTLAVAVLAACPRRAETSVAGTDEEQLDQYTARLEELRTRAQAETLSCDQNCSFATEACDLAKKICDIAARQSTAQDRCVNANEDCARFNDACASCR
ncbi:MAG: hypothetical protein IRZ16_08325 [Myxococcaceae bacterium]|nr:hypothetical protein [Myxococcaceae bacterium]